MAIDIESPGGNVAELKAALAAALAGSGAPTTPKLSFQSNNLTSFYGAIGPVGAYAIVDQPLPASGGFTNSGNGNYAEIRTPVDATDYSNQGYLNGTYAAAYHLGSGTVYWLTGQYNDAENLGGGDITNLIGTYSFLSSNGGSVSQGVANWSEIDGSGALLYASAYGYYFVPPSAGTCTDLIVYWSNDISGVATNGYYSWFDSRGVLRVKEDASFDSVGQAITALYNPQFTKYTPGAPNYERGVFGRWNGNVFESGPEAGGTGTLRHHRLIGTTIGVPSTTPASASAAGVAGTVTWDSGFIYVCTATNTWKRVAIATW